MTQLLKDKPWTLGVLVLVIAGIGYGVWSFAAAGGRNANAHEWNGAAYTPPRQDVEFTLTNTEGEQMSTSELKGKVVLLYFGYTHCPDFCPATLTDFQRVKMNLGDQAEDVAFMMVTVDPERDTPERMKEYLEFFDPEFIGLTGTQEELTPVKQEFGIISLNQEATPQPNGEDFYAVDHSTQAYLLNPDGELQLEYAFGTTAEDMTEDVKHLLDS